MLERIIGLFCSLLCSFPFFVISVYGKDSKVPINFWSGDTSLKSKVKDLPGYNKEMAALYRKCALAFLITGIAFLAAPIAGTIIICLDITLGIWLAYRSYKKILGLYS